MPLEHGTAGNVWWKSNFKQICFQFFLRKVSSFKRFNRNRELILNCWRSHRESTFSNIQLGFRKKMLFGNGSVKGRRYIREM